MITACKRTGQIARSEAVKCQVLRTLVHVLPETGSRKRRIVAATLDQEVFASITFFARDEKDGKLLALLSISLDADRHREQLRLHPSIQLPKSWADGVDPELRVIVECFVELVARCHLSVTGLVRLKKNAPTLVVDGEPVSRPLSALKNGWLVAANGPLAILDELSVFYAVAPDLSEVV